MRDRALQSLRLPRPTGPSCLALVQEQRHHILAYGSRWLSVIRLPSFKLYRRKSNTHHPPAGRRRWHPKARHTPQANSPSTPCTLYKPLTLNTGVITVASPSPSRPCHRLRKTSWPYTSRPPGPGRHKQHGPTAHNEAQRSSWKSDPTLCTEVMRIAAAPSLKLYQHESGCLAQLQASSRVMIKTPPSLL